MSFHPILIIIAELELSDFAVTDAQNGCEITQIGFVYLTNAYDNIKQVAASLIKR